MSYASPTWATALQQLSEGATPQSRSEAVDHLTTLLQESDWRLPESIGGQVLISALRDRLSDTNW